MFSLYIGWDLQMSYATSEKDNLYLSTENLIKFLITASLMYVVLLCLAATRFSAAIRPFFFSLFDLITMSCKNNDSWLQL